MNLFRKILIWTVIAWAAISIGLLVAGKFYYWKALVYNYVDIDDLGLFYARTVKATSPGEWKLSSAYNKLRLTTRLDKELGDFETVAFLVIRNDSILHESYHEGYDSASWSNSFSMSKSFVGALVGIAVAEGKIGSLDDAVVQYLPAFNKPENGDLTIRHLLTMSSGLNWDESYSSLTSQTTEAYYGKRLDRQMMRLKVVEPPGINFEYMSCNTQLLAFVLRDATGMSVAEYASKKLWEPMHAVHDAQWSLARQGGAEKAYCCFYSNARDFARIGKLYLDSGRWEGKQVIPEAYVLESLQKAPLNDHGKPNKQYGYHWWLDEMAGHEIFYARGILGQYVIVIPDERMVIVRLGHRRDKAPDGSLRDVPVYVEEVLRLFGRGQKG